MPSLTVPATRGQARVGVAGQVEARVDRDAVPADGDARPVDVAEGLGVGGVDHRATSTPSASAWRANSLAKRDVDVAVGRLGELGQLGGLGRAHAPHLRVEERARTASTPRASPSARQAADELRVGREVREDAPAEDALGAEDRCEVLARRRSPLRAASAGAMRPRVVPTGHRRLDADHDRLPAAGSPRPMSSTTASRIAPVRLRVRVDHAAAGRRSTSSGAVRDRGGRVGRGAQPPGRGRPRRAPRSRPASPGNGGAAGVDGLDHARVDVAAHDLVAGAGDAARRAAGRSCRARRRRRARRGRPDGLARRRRWPAPPRRTRTVSRPSCERDDRARRRRRSSSRRTPRARRAAARAAASA